MKNKELMVIKPVQRTPQYGGRTLIEKITAYYLRGEIYFDVREVAILEHKTAYKVSDGEIIESRKSAIKRQTYLDLGDRVDLFIADNFAPVEVSTGDGPVKLDPEVVELSKVRFFLKNFDRYIRKIPHY